MDAKLDPEGFPLPRCAWHPDRRPVAACVHCGRTVCEACATLGPEGYRCPECPPAGEETGARAGPALALADPVAAAARLFALIGLVPLIGALGALAAIGLAVIALRQRRHPGLPVRRGASAPSPIITMVLGLLGLAGTAVVIWWFWLKG